MSIASQGLHQSAGRISPRPDRGTRGRADHVGDGGGMPEDGPRGALVIASISVGLLLHRLARLLFSPVHTRGSIG